MRRRGVFWLVAGGLLAGCGPRGREVAVVDGGGDGDGGLEGRAAVAGDYSWFEAEKELSRGFCFTWVRGFKPSQTLRRLGGTELERIGWDQLVGSGDGQRGYSDRYFLGITRFGDWSLILEDNGTFGVVDALLGPLSAGTTVVSHYRADDGHGRMLLLEDGVVSLDFDPLDSVRRVGARSAELAVMIQSAGFGASNQPSYCAAAAFALTERLTGVPMTAAALRERTYIFAALAKG